MTGGFRVRGPLDVTPRSMFGLVGPEPKLVWLTDVVDDLDEAWEIARRAAPEVSLSCPDGGVWAVEDDGQVAEDPYPAVLAAETANYALDLEVSDLQRLVDAIASGDPDASP